MPVAIVGSDLPRVANRLPVKFDKGLPTAVGSYTLADLLVKAGLTTGTGIETMLRNRPLEKEDLHILRTSEVELWDVESDISSADFSRRIVAPRRVIGANWRSFLLVATALCQMELDKPVSLPSALLHCSSAWRSGVYERQGGIHVVRDVPRDLPTYSLWLVLSPGTNDGCVPSD